VVCPRIGGDGPEGPDDDGAVRDGGAAGGSRDSRVRGDGGPYAGGPDDGGPDDGGPDDGGPDDGGPDDGGLYAESTRPPLAVLDLAAELGQGPLAGLRLTVLHGRLPPDEKDRAMLAFAKGSVDVLVTTTVVEVGVDVPNATAMVIMDADRFGVSQLHQLRGRVGRGSHEGLCLLVTQAEAGGKSRQRLDAVAGTLDGFKLSRLDLEQRREGDVLRQRLDAVAGTLDGFKLSRLDLEQRREGDVLGAAQAGRRSSLKLLTLLKDEELIGRARREATELVSADPALAGQPALASALRVLLAQERAEFLEKA
jgi:ATP-dependent DNA helicase RecG